MSEASDLAARLLTLQQAHPWMDALTSTTLASQPSTTQTLLQTADTLHQYTANSWDGKAAALYDPVLHRPQSVRAFAQGYIGTTLGGNPFNAGSLGQMQRDMQTQGYGKDLTVNGVWDADWQHALQARAGDHFHDMLSGERPMATTSHGLLHSVLHAISPTGIGSAVVGALKSLPSDLVQLVGNANPFTTIGAAAGAITHADLGDLGALPGDFMQRRSDISHDIQAGMGQNWLSQHLVGKPFEKDADVTLRDAFAQQINDVGTVALLVPGVGEAVGVGAKGFTALFKGSTLADAQIGQGVLVNTLGRTAGHEAAQRTPGTVARAVGSQTGKRVLTGAAVGGTLGGAQSAVTGGDITQGISQGVAMGAALGAAGRIVEKTGQNFGMPKDAFDNMPVLKHTGALVDKLTDADGMYYRMRTRLAKPYEYGAVRLAGSALSKGQAASLKLNGLSWLENTVGDDPNTQLIARSIAGSHPLDPINDALHHVGVSVHGHRVQADLDQLLYFLHGPLKTGIEPSDSQGLVGDLSRSVRGVHDGYEAALQNTGAKSRILRVTSQLGQDYGALLKHAGGDESILNEWMGNKVKQAAASWYAERAMSLAPAETQKLVSSDYQLSVDTMRAARSAAWHDPEIMDSSVRELLGAEHANFLETFMRNEIASTLAKPGEYLRHDIGNFIPAGRILSHDLLPVAEKELLTPQEFTPSLAGLLPELQTPEHLSTLREAGMMPAAGATRPATGPVAPGAIGLLRKGKLTSQDAKLAAQGFAKRISPHLDILRPPQGRSGKQLHVVPNDQRAAASESINGINDEIVDFLHHQFGYDAHKLRTFQAGNPAKTAEKLLSLLDDSAKNLASKVHLADGASEKTKRAFDQIDALGYQVVHGTDIGHSFRADLPRVTGLGRLDTTERKIAETLGLGGQRFSRRDLSATIRLETVSALQKLVDDGRINLPPTYTVQTLLNELSDHELLGKSLPWTSNVLFSVARRAHKHTLDELMTLHGGTLHDAESRLKGQLALAGGRRALSRKDFTAVLTRDHDLPWTAGKGDGEALMSQADADLLYTTFMTAQANTATYQVGLTHLEDLARFAPFRMVGKGGRWDSDGMRALLALPNTLVRARDKLRFTLNPLFSVRRVVKTNFKMLADGVDGTATPVKSMIDGGGWDEAHTLLDRLQGAETGRYDFLDEAERVLHDNDIFGLYNPRQYEAYYAWKKKEAGFSDEEIRKGLIRVFTYGARGQEGRTALERTTNLVFFPFSFEKTVVRNIGGYLADHQAQALVLANSLDAYRQFSAEHENNPLAMSWMDTHLPVLHEALRLNAFAHGISPGEFGGINRPILNAFLPQSWATGKDTKDTLARFIPAINDLHRIMGELSDQGAITRQSVLNGMARVERQPSSSLNRRPSAESHYQQITDALGFRNDLVDAFRGVLDYNGSHTKEEQKYHFGYSDKIPQDVQGLVISRENLNQIVAHAFPAYDPTYGMVIAKQKQHWAQRWIADRHDTPNHAVYAEYYKRAQTALRHLSGDDYATEQAAQVQALFRDTAKDFAKTDPEFRTFYEKTFASMFGPLELR